ncbi:D12 class N6 adenine-specific DNA methyltransferase [Natronincola peptidivorans]|uniref:site-specific DNA-methyltransferase (adenine-specific) n=1 Tax=Natronincola peptidivorans TaxID=426128 RepID=A0A1I0EKT6_9FIRM|nr:DNA adenine methylase [Natronincola peptidivorans]SET46061.1 D12 class N6 adenine-specific DNA methyltransferase [Natronincola peptidivorans]
MGNIKKGEQLTLLKAVVDSNSESFRPIHYLGSKLRILEFIGKVIDDIDPTNSRVCDLFSGSGTVSQFLSKNRPVTAIDIQEYSRVLTSSVLKPLSSYYSVEKVVSECINSEHYKKLMWCLEPMIECEEKFIEEALQGSPFFICDLVENGSIIKFEEGCCEAETVMLKEALSKSADRLKESNFIIGPEALTSRYFGGTYFSFKQSVQLDALLEYSLSLDINDRDTFTAAILSAASDIVNTVGKQFAQPLKPFDSDGKPKKSIVNKIVTDRKNNAFEIFSLKLESFLGLRKTNFDHRTYRMDFSDALDNLSKDVKVVYADPPYTRYHYSRYYHVLETICLRDNPKISKTIVKGKEKFSRGIYRNDRHQSPFSIKTQAKEAFDTLFKKVSQNNSSLVLSYSPFAEDRKSTPRMQRIEELESLGRQYFNNVKSVSVGQFAHSKLNKTDKNFETNYSAEILIVCKK